MTDVSAGLELLAGLIKAVNATWEHRQEVAAVTERHRAARPLDVFGLLPQTNCRQCGESTCSAFAGGLLQRTLTLTECAPLRSDDALTVQRKALQAMLL